MNETLWLKTLSGALEELEDIPLWGSPPPFPFKKLAKNMAEVFSIEELGIQAKGVEHIQLEELTKGMGKSPLVKPIALSPLPGTFFLIIPNETKKALVQAALTTDKTAKGITDETIEEGFFISVLLTALAMFNELNPYGNLTALLEEDTPLPEEGALCVDLSLTINEHPHSMRLCTPKEAHQAFKTHFRTEAPASFGDPSIQSIPLPLQLEAGSTVLSLQEWEQAQVGDLLLLDRCTFDPKDNRGTAQLSINGTPLFEVRIKDGEIKLLEHAQHLEEYPMIDDKTPDDDDEELELTPSLSKEEEDEDAPPLWSSEEESTTEGEMLATKAIPLTLVVEVGRLTMPLAKLTQLKPGNILDLALNPQLGVYLTIGSKRVAKGELVKIGEGVGVKILKVGS